ncbi:hypothetical protein [Okeania sp. SIO3I5]|nr:hypothetical protein [Okeania sp. SIO3I5]
MIISQSDRPVPKQLESVGVWSPNPNPLMLLDTNFATDAGMMPNH